MEKTCKKCGTPKPITEYGPNARLSDGLRIYCRVCEAGKARDRYAADPEAGRESCRRSYRANKEPRKERRRIKESTTAHKEARNKRQAGRKSKVRDYNLRTKYGITLEDYNRMLEEQGGVCGSCKKPETRKQRGKSETLPLVVDHCHTTGKLRKLLCHKCNSALGHLNDDPDAIRNLLAYIQEHAA